MGCQTIKGSKDKPQVDDVSISAKKYYETERWGRLVAGVPSEPSSQGATVR
jgi:hypothetical protein